MHAKGGKIALQLWHLGRAAIEEGFDAVSASDIPFEGGAPAPRPMTLEEIAEAPQLYAQAARNFIEGAGGDMVEGEFNKPVVKTFANLFARDSSSLGEWLPSQSSR